MTDTCAKILLAALCITSGAAFGQSIGGAVPPFQAPAPVDPPQRNENVTVPVARDNPFKSNEDFTRSFASAYQRAGKPRLGFYWNRQLADTLNEWYSDSRLVITNQREGNASGRLNSSSMNGDLSLQGTSSSQTTIEAQRRTADRNARLQPSESWEWQFQEGFLGPFLSAGAMVVDRTAILRITGINAKGADANSVEAMALQGMADLLVEVLVAPQAQSTVGYELRARVLDVKTGRIVSYVNSRGLKEWNAGNEAVATSHGFDLPDDDDDVFGPESGTAYAATSEGFVRTRKPPKLSRISQDLAYNVMSGLMNQSR